MVEFDGGLPREEAEIQAFARCVTEWLNRNPVYSPARHCLGCGKPEYAHDPLLPFGTESTGHAWLHSHCWPTWHEVRKAKAVTALAAMGINVCAGYVPRAASTAPAQACPIASIEGATRIPLDTEECL
jgi:hypothetical protein